MSQTAHSSHPLQLPKRSTLFDETCDRLGLSAAAREQVAAYVATLGKWQPRLNLIGPKTWADVWDRHVVDSLQCLDHLGTADEGRGWADIGTGAGFPGVVLALAAGIPVRLVESDQRKAAFLLAVKTATGAPVTVVNSRIESLPPAPLDVLFARAFAPLPRLLDCCEPVIDAETTLILHKGRRAQDELDEAAQAFSFEAESFPSIIDSDSVILRLRNLRRRP